VLDKKGRLLEAGSAVFGGLFLGAVRAVGKVGLERLTRRVRSRNDRPANRSVAVRIGLVALIVGVGFAASAWFLHPQAALVKSRPVIKAALNPPPAGKGVPTPGMVPAPGTMSLQAVQAVLEGRPDASGGQSK
jgi:hypothetical protein